jgi:hypothetical protein
VATYDYRDAAGRLLYQTVRKEPKGFYQRRADGAGGWLYNLDGVDRVLYRLPDLLAAGSDDWVFVVEGEKDADRVVSLGLVATTNVGGAGKWRDRYSETLRGRRVCLLPDQDEPGRKHALDVAASLVQHGAAEVKVLLLPGLPEKGDVSDWLNEGHEAEEVLKRAEQAPKWEPEPSSVEPVEDGPSPTAAASSRSIGRETQAARLYKLALETARALFLSPQGEGYVLLARAQGTRCYPLRSPDFRRWLRHTFVQQEKTLPRAEAVQIAIETLDAAAAGSGVTREVFLRLAEQDGAVYLDLARDDGQAVRLTPTGWELVSDPPVAFLRGRGMRPLPTPLRGGDLATLRPFVNVTDDTWPLLAGFLVGCLCPDSPYPVLCLHGEQGSAKSTAARVLKALLDPNKASLRAAPRDARDAMITASHNHLLCFDNLSRLPGWLSDLLCCLTTGAGYSTRALYTNDDEILLTARRPVVLTGIAEVVDRSDLLDRSILLGLEPIPEEQRRTEATFWADFQAVYPALLGALCDAVTVALRNRPQVHLERLPRLADFAVWVQAAEPALGWSPGTFLNAYDENRTEAHSLALEGSPVADLVRELARTEGPWTGTATDLYDRLCEILDQAGKKPGSDFPQGGRGLGKVLRRLAPNLRAVGVEVRFPRSGRERKIEIYGS